MRVRIFSRKQIQELEPLEGSVLISISTPGCDPPHLREGWEDILHLQFDDACAPYDVLRGMVLFDEGLADLVHAFIAKHRHKDFVIHCDAGKSRSVGIGVFLRDVYEAELVLHSVDATSPIEFANQNANSLVVSQLKQRLWREHFRLQEDPS